MKRRAFTLAEILVAASVMLIILAALATFTTFTLRMNARIAAGNDLDNRIRPFLTRFETDVSNATSVSVPESDGALNPTEVSLLRPRIVAGRMTGDTKKITYRFAADGGALYRTEDDITTTELEHLQSLRFEYKSRRLDSAANQADIAALAVNATFRVPMGPTEPVKTTTQSALIRLRTRL